MSIKVYGFREQEQGIMDLDAEQAFAGGLIDVYAVTDYLDLVFNDAGFIDGLEARAVVLGEGKVINEQAILTIIHGDCFVRRHDGKGNFESIKEGDIQTIKHYVKKVISNGNGIIMIE